MKRTFFFAAMLVVTTAFLGLQARAESPPSDSKSAKEPQVELRINNMMCGGCTSRVSKLLQTQPGISDVSVNLGDKAARFTCEKTKGCDLERTLSKLSKIGYPAKITHEEQEKK
ncbi:MAG: cation transporter [Bdellovibrionales bacterium]|nr:cation transporter [Bdellovibrionales bacterium]